MKNKGRKHLTTSANCKGCLVGITRPITSMGSGRFKHNSSNKKIQKWWNKRVRGYFKSQTKDLL